MNAAGAEQRTSERHTQHEGARSKHPLSISAKARCPLGVGVPRWQGRQPLQQGVTPQAGEEGHGAPEWRGAL